MISTIVSQKDDLQVSYLDISGLYVKQISSQSLHWVFSYIIAEQKVKLIYCYYLVFKNHLPDKVREDAKAS